jgi:hypothetical protein
MIRPFFSGGAAFGGRRGIERPHHQLAKSVDDAIARQGDQADRARLPRLESHRGARGDIETVATGLLAIEVERRIRLEEVIVRADLNRSVTGIAHDDLDARATGIELDVAVFDQHFARDHEEAFRSGRR